MRKGPMWARWRRSPVAVQRKLGFAVRAEKRERVFKRSIAAVTALLIVGFVAGTAAGRRAAAQVSLRARTMLDRIVGVPPDRSLEQERITDERLRNAGGARQALLKYAEPGSASDAFMRAVQMDAGRALIRWGNVDRSIVLSSAVFEADDKRSYRMKPGVRAVWIIGLSIRDSLGMFLIPDTSEAREAATKAGGRVVPESVQTTNSWGCRGPEPDPLAPVRVLVLGDSMMQGSLVGEDDTPPAKLEGYLHRALGTRVSVLNTGHIGYSPEQYAQTLSAFGDRFEPQFVIISICHNDFGDMNNPANWAEGEYWLDRILETCTRRGWHFLMVIAVDEFAVVGPRRGDQLQIGLSRLFKHSALRFVDPTASFTDALLRLKNEAARRGEPVRDPLYNLHLLGDRHYSPLGADLWARVVARRLLMTWDGLALSGMPCPEPVMRHAQSERPWIPGDLDSESFNQGQLH